MNANFTVYVVDDDADVRDSVVALAKAHGYQTECFSAVEQFLPQLESDSTACVVTDLRVGGMSGMELLKRVKASESRIPVVVITGYGDVPTAVNAMRLGAVQFLEKPFLEHDLIAAIEEARQRLASSHSIDQYKATIQARFDSLTDGERDVMRLLVEGALNKNIAKALGIALRTAELRRSKVMKKMQADSLPALVRMAMLIECFPAPELA